MYFIKAPWLLKKIYPEALTWHINSDTTPSVYITFDDGPHPQATLFALEQLAQYKAHATFFCIGKNVVEYPDIYSRILDEGHTVGNHTHNHTDGWKVNTKQYLENIHNAERYINSKLFRPPYGHIKPGQARQLIKLGYKIIMWDVLSADFDKNITPQKCWENIALHIRPGSIIVFHDSAKAMDRMHYALPRTLAFCRKMKWEIKSL